LVYGNRIFFSSNGKNRGDGNKNHKGSFEEIYSK